jgi:ATP-binding cassette, subfamily B, bacterial
VNKTAKKKFKYYLQLEQKDCGPTCLQMLANYYGKQYSLKYLGELSFVNRTGASMAGLKIAAEAIGFRTIVNTFTLQEILHEAPLPAILFWNKKHFVIIVDIAKGSKKDSHVIIADPERGKVILPYKTLEDKWIGERNTEGYALVVEPNDDFQEKSIENAKETKLAQLPIFKQLFSYKNYFLQIALGMFVAAGINLFFPVLTQQLVDKGVQQKNVSFIILLLFAQLGLFVGNLLVEVIRGWSVLYINARINIQIISSFLIKLIKLPIGFFDTRLMTDIMLRIDDHERIEEFLSSSSLNVLFSFITVIALSVVFCFYSPVLFFIFMIFSIISIIWILFFLKRNKAIDYNRFELLSESRNQLYEIIDGMCEIKLNNAEKSKRFEWEKQQVKLYDVNKKSLKINQWQQIGFSSITQLKTLLITFLAAYSVVNNQITLGTMLSITLLVGQLNNPLENFIHFFQSLQNARISLDRLNDIYSRQDEDELYRQRNSVNEGTHDPIGRKNIIQLNDISFSYNGILGPPVFNKLNAQIHKNKVTAIVGSSGSGKTTLFKLLLKFYEPQAGKITIENTKLQDIHADNWRRQCGVVMQNGYIFSDTIIRNIAINEENPNIEQIQNACTIANIKTFIEDLPLSYQTQIGGSGIGLSAGQSQRILIARAVYKNPEYLFFDEATSALDAENERIIVENLKKFYQGKTVIIIAHRLSTVKDADEIIVLHKGEIAEQGSHTELIKKMGFYYTLIKNQLELGA